jgi:hypothetical protein
MSMTQTAGTLGFVYGGPGGAILGALAGAALDSMKQRPPYQPNYGIRKKVVYYYHKR